MAMSAAAVKDVAAWILLALAIQHLATMCHPIVSYWVFLCCLFVFIVISESIGKHCHQGGLVDETYICAALAIVLAAELVTDAIAIHAMFRAFVIKILVPKDRPFTGAGVQKVEDLVSGLWRLSYSQPGA